MNLSRTAAIVAAIFALALVEFPAAKAQEKDKEKYETVKIPTVDGVDLVGKFYMSPKKSAPTVILLHPIGKNSNKKTWLGLAEYLQKKYSVMAFDFRGHGDSKQLGDEKLFWQNPLNRNGVKGKITDTAIDAKNFKKEYQTVLLNDIAAVKSFLDRRNDQGLCNTSSTILIGAESGATLGSIWLNSEWHRYKVVPNPLTPFAPAQMNKSPEGNNVIACVWLSITSELGVGKVSVTNALSLPAAKEKTAMTFLYGEGDKSKTASQLLEKSIKGNSKKDDPRLEFTGTIAIKANLSGMDLLEKGTNTDEAIMAYLDTVTKKRGNEWVERSFLKSKYVWRSEKGILDLRPDLDSPNLIFSNYAQFFTATR